MRRAVLTVTIALAAGCAGEGGDSDVRWTVREAESVRSIRGMHVRVDECRGLGSGQRAEGRARYRRFECRAGTRAASDRFDTVAVLYVLHPEDEYEGPRSEHRLTDVRFIGGPGIP
jgi:hypothetical protein